MEVIEDGNIMDRIPILLQRDLEYYQTNQTVLSETVCRGVVGGRLDFPRNASFAAVKIVLWLEEEFSIAFQQGSGMFVVTEQDIKSDGGVAKTSDPDKFVQLAIKSSDSLLEHLHVLVQEALDHADLPVLTATLGAAALLKNSLYCYVQHFEDMGNSDRLARLQACYKRYVTMSEAVAERVLDLHSRVVSLYVLQDAGGRALAEDACTRPAGTPSVQGWWLYMNGSKKDLWDTVPPRMAQRIFAGMLNETLTILTVRYCQSNTSDSGTTLLINDILNILLCVAQLLPSICSSGSDLCGLEPRLQTRDVRDVHAKCHQLFTCAVFRGAQVHFIHDAFKNEEDKPRSTEGPQPWFTFVSPKLFDNTIDDVTTCAQDLPNKTAIGLDLTVLLAQPQPSWNLLVKVLMMRDCHLARMLLIHAMRHMSVDNQPWRADGLWCSPHQGTSPKCGGFLCTADGFCMFKRDRDAGEEYALAAGALTYVIASVGSEAEVKSTLCYALELSGRDWSACLDKRQVWCHRRPSWLAGIMALVGSSLQFIPPILVNAVQNGASMYQTMCTCLQCMSRCVFPRALSVSCGSVQRGAPARLAPVRGSVLLQVLVAVMYDEIVKWAAKEASKEKNVAVEINGQPPDMGAKNKPKKQVKIVSFGNTTTSRSVSFDGSHSSASSIALAIAEALCSIDEDDKHTAQLHHLLEHCTSKVDLSTKFGLEDFPDFAELYEEGDVPASNAERPSDAAALTSQILMTPAGRDSLRVIYEHLQVHSERVLAELGVVSRAAGCVPLSCAPLLYTMFHIGRRPFDQYLRGEWPMPWSKLVSVAKAWSGRDGARAHINRRADMRTVRGNAKSANKLLLELYNMFKNQGEGLLYSS